MDIHLFREFLTTARHMNISHAATELHMSQPSLSRHISDLEREFGHKLFGRKRPMTLTRAGEIVLRRSGEIWDSYSLLMAEIRILRTSVTGTIRIHDMSYYPRGLEAFTAAIQSLRSLYPNVAVELVSTAVTSLSEDLVRGMVDISFIFKGGAEALKAPEIDENLYCTRIGARSDRIAVGVGKRHRLADRSSLRLIDLANEWIVRPAGILYDSPSDGFIELCRTKGFEPKYQLLNCDSLQQYWMQDFSERLFIFSTSSLDDGMFPTSRARQVKVFELADQDMDWCMFAVCRKDNENPAVHAFTELLGGAHQDEIE